jgi:hypothetical protein
MSVRELASKLDELANLADELVGEAPDPETDDYGDDRDDVLTETLARANNALQAAAASLRQAADDFGEAAENGA